MDTSSNPSKPSKSGVPDHELLAVAALVEEALTRRLRWLRFPEPLEDLFERETGGERTHYMIVVGLIALVLYDLFLFSDYTMVPGIFGTALVIRLGIITPIAIFVMVAQSRGLRPWLRESLGAMVVFAGCVGLVYLLLLTPEPYAAGYMNGLILTMMLGNIVLRLRFLYAAATSLGILVIYTAFILAAVHLVPIVQANNIIVLCATAIITLLANYALERDHRLNYLLRLQDRIDRAKLVERNVNLAQLAHIDSLTGIANRRELDEHLARLQQGSGSAMLAIIMFDIDHFKLYNDQYGHPAGDECLRRVSGVLGKSLRHGNDMVARFGGEEFVIVLPDCNMQTAHTVANRMRKAVFDLAIPHASSPTAAVITVSGGVEATKLDIDVQVILAHADAALYRAKATGRNCVEQYLPSGSDVSVP